MKPAPALFTFLLFCLIGAMPTNSNAENWKSVGEGFYVDIDSSTRSGDIGSVYVKKGSNINQESFDCKKRIFLSRTGNETPLSDWFVLGEMFKAACTRWYEVWKR